MMATLTFAADHPAGPGHFPGNPIIPGAALLEAAIASIAGERGHNATPCEIAQAKFTHPVRPGDAVELGWIASDDLIAFTATVGDGTVVMTGKVSFAC